MFTLLESFFSSTPEKQYTPVENLPCTPTVCPLYDAFNEMRLRILLYYPLKEIDKIDMGDVRYDPSFWHIRSLLCYNPVLLVDSYEQMMNVKYIGRPPICGEIDTIIDICCDVSLMFAKEIVLHSYLDNDERERQLSRIDYRINEVS